MEREMRQKLRRRAWWNGISLTFRISVLVCITLVTIAVVRRRVALGNEVKSLIAEMNTDPLAYYSYTDLMPGPGSPVWNLTDIDDDYAQDLLIKSVGDWFENVESLLANHCDMQHMNMVLARHGDDEWCGPGSTHSSLGCAAGYYTDAATGAVEACPDGFFCPSNQVCFVLCALGGQCSASRREERQALNTATNQMVNFTVCTFTAGIEGDVGFSHTLPCPGVSSLKLCPEGYYCPAPVKLHVCPEGYFCPLGSNEPIKCPYFATCPHDRMSRPEYSANFFRAIAFGFLLMVLTYYMASAWSGALKNQRDRSAFQAYVSDRLLGADMDEDGAGTTGQRQQERGRTGEGNAGASSKPTGGPGLLPSPSTHSPPEFAARNDMLVDAIPRADPVMDIAFHEMGLTLNSTGKKVLAGVTGEFRAGRLAAIMGPSGVGKTTFLNALCGRATYGTMSGEVFINNSRANVKSYTHLVSLVPQDDIMHSWLTVKENLWIYAKMRQRAGETNSTINQKVDSVMHTLGLYANRHTIIGDARKRGISGGQRKRVNIAMELVLNPSILFCDEPTSGLDSTTSYELIESLRTIAEQRMVNIVAVLHQPSAKIFSLCHDVLLLGKRAGVGGATVYLGGSDGALAYFSRMGFVCPQRENPADWYMDLIAGKVPLPGSGHFDPSELAVTWDKQRRKQLRRQSSKNAQQKQAAGPSSASPSTAKPFEYAVYAGSPTSQGLPSIAVDWRTKAQYYVTILPSFGNITLLLTFRAVLEHTRFPGEFMYEVLLQVMTGLVIGALYQNFTFHDLQQMNFMVTLAIGFTIALSSMRVFGASMLVYWREAAPGVGMGVSRTAYFLSKNLVELPRLLLLTCALLSTFYPMACPRCPFSVYVWVCFAAAFAISGWAMILSIAQDPKSAQLSAVVIMVIFCMFCGVTPTLSEIDEMGPLSRFLAWISFARWYIECLFTEETIRMSEAWRMPPSFYRSAGRESVLLLLTQYGYIEGSTRYNIAILLLMGVITRVFALFALTACNRDKMGLHTPGDWFAFACRDPLVRCCTAMWRCVRWCLPRWCCSCLAGNNDDAGSRMPPCGVDLTPSSASFCSASLTLLDVSSGSDPCAAARDATNGLHGHRWGWVAGKYRKKISLVCAVGEPRF